MNKIKNKAAQEYAKEVENNHQGEDWDSNDLIEMGFIEGYNYAKRNDPDVNALFDVLDHAIEIGYFNGSGSTEMMAKDAINNYFKAIKGD